MYSDFTQLEEVVAVYPKLLEYRDELTIKQPKMFTLLYAFCKARFHLSFPFHVSSSGLLALYYFHNIKSSAPKYRKAKIFVVCQAAEFIISIVILLS